MILWDFYDVWELLKKLDEDYLIETPINSLSSLYSHREKHILHPGEAYNPREPKFKHSISDEEYIEAAVLLANISPVGTSDMAYLDVVGWETEPDPNNNRRTFMKVRWRALKEHLPLDAKGLIPPSEIVVFTKLDNPTENDIKTYYLITAQKLKSKIAKKIGDIPLI